MKQVNKASVYAFAVFIVVALAHVVFYLTDIVYSFFGLTAIVYCGVIFIVALSVVMVNWRKREEEVTYGQALKFGMLVLLGYDVFTFGYDLLFYYVLAPDFNKQLAEHILQAMVKMHVPSDQIQDTKLKFQNAPQNPMSEILVKFVARYVLNFLALLIVAIFARKEKDYSTE